MPVIAVINGRLIVMAMMRPMVFAPQLHGVNTVQENECHQHHGWHAGDAHRLIKHLGGPFWGRPFFCTDDVGRVV